MDFYELHKPIYDLWNWVDTAGLENADEWFRQHLGYPLRNNYDDYEERLKTVYEFVHTATTLLHRERQQYRIFARMGQQDNSAYDAIIDSYVAMLPVRQPDNSAFQVAATAAVRGVLDAIAYGQATQQDDPAIILDQIMDNAAEFARSALQSRPSP